LSLTILFSIFAPGVNRRFNMKTEEHQKMVLHSFETPDLGRIDLLIYAGVHTWPGDGSLRSIWFPQLYIASDDMLANYTGANVDRHDSYPRSVREDIRDWSSACVNSSSQYTVGDWDASWIRECDHIDMETRGKIFFEDAYKREFVLYHVGPICSRNGFEAFDPRMELFKIEKIEVARPMGATAALRDADIVFAGSDKRRGRRLPDLRN